MKVNFLQLSIWLLILIGCFSVVSNAYTLSCGDSIGSDVVLTEDLDCTTRSGLSVSNNGVTIDLNGFTLSGAGVSSGIDASGYDNLSVKNGTIRGFWSGINSSHSDYLSVTDVTFYEVNEGIRLYGGNKAHIKDNRFIKIAAHSVLILVDDVRFSANENLVSHNEFYQIGWGVEICGSQADKNIISDNLIWNSSDTGISLNATNHNRVYRNEIWETPNGAALLLNNSSFNVIEDNRLYQGAYSGISVYGNAGTPCLDRGVSQSVKNRFTDNLVSGFSVAVGLGLSVAKPSSVVENTILNSHLNDNQYGIWFRNGTQFNSAYNNDFTGTISPILDSGVDNDYDY